jgi:hypothetical protein
LVLLAHVRSADVTETVIVRGLRMSEFGPGRIRAVMHFGISSSDLERALSFVRGVLLEHGLSRG